jgi:hypothetical protein
VKFDHRYWIFIAAAISFATLAAACTLYLAALRKEHFMECNSTSAACFSVPGMVLGGLLGRAGEYYIFT